MEPSSSLPSSGLQGRRRECEVLDRLIADARIGGSGALVLHGEAGCGKTAMLEYVRMQAVGFHVARAVGIESEMELAFAGVHQLCAPMLGLLDRLALPQQSALRVALGLRQAAAPDRFLTGLAVLGLLAESAEDGPLVCLVDDAQWLDQSSIQVLAFVARRVKAEPIALMFAMREFEGQHPLIDLPSMAIPPLDEQDARTILASAIRGPLDDQVRDRIIAEARGNPLALLELTRGLSPAELAGGFGLPDRPLATRIEQSFARRLRALPRSTQLLLITAAAEPVGDRSLLRRAAADLAIPADAWAAAETEDLVGFGTRVRFRHPLVRSAIYQAASAADRRAAHRALAEATDPDSDPDRRAWHRAHAAAEFDEDVAAELERSADRAEARGGLAAAAAFLARATALTSEPTRRRERALGAARTALQAGSLNAAIDLLAIAEAGPLTDLQGAHVDLLRAQIAFAINRGNQAAPLLLSAAQQLEPLDAALARETYLDALSAALFTGRLAVGPDLKQVSQAALASPLTAQPPRPSDVLLDGLALLFARGHSAAKPVLQQALAAFRSGDISHEEQIRWLWLACVGAMELWDDEAWEALSSRYVTSVRDAGALSELPLALVSRTVVHLYAGELTAAASLVREFQAVTEATGSNLAPYGALALAAWQGNEAELRRLAETSTRDVTQRGEGTGVTVIQWTLAFLYNGLGRYAEALTAAQQATAFVEEIPASYWALVELIEAASRRSDPELAVAALERLSRATSTSATGWALGVEARSRALLSKGATADVLYRTAIEHLAHTRTRVELARAHLVYGEWLRQEHRRPEARKELLRAYDMFATAGIRAFADRTGRELRAAGHVLPGQSVETSAELTSQEALIARFASDGLSNRQIGARMFLSPRTVEWHLGNVFTKLRITSRRGLAQALQDIEHAGGST